MSLKRYKLVCPVCDSNEIVLPAETPDIPFCQECSDEIDLNSLQKFIKNWNEYLKDRLILLESELKSDKIEDIKQEEQQQ